MTEPWFRTNRHQEAEDKVREAIRLIVEARTVLTLGEFHNFIRGNVRALGGQGFLASMGKALLDAAEFKADAYFHPRTETAQQHEPSTATKQNETGTIAGTESD
jgi:hypothetical protein